MKRQRRVFSKHAYFCDLEQPTLGLDFDAYPSRYSDLRTLSREVCGVKRFNFTTALVVGLDASGRQRRYCYGHDADARAAPLQWNGEAHPGGPWIKCKGAGIDLLNRAWR